MRGDLPGDADAALPRAMTLRDSIKTLYEA